MNNSLLYKAGSIQVSDPRKENIVVYAHPGDKINLDFDISSLKKTLVNGDLVIRTQSGGTVTIANYSIMFMQNQFPAIIDSLSAEYGYYDFLGGAKPTSSSDNPDSYVVNRVISTPKSDGFSGEFLATGQEFLEDNYAVKELVGRIDVEEQHPILANDVSINPYMLLTLYPEGTAKYDVPVIFRYAGRTILNQEEESTLPVVTRILNPKSAPLYGTKETFSTSEVGDNEVSVIAGGGNLKGNEAAETMYSAQHLDYSSQKSSVYYQAYTGNDVVRGLNLYVTDQNTVFTSVLLQDVPPGITFISTETTEVQPLGNGSFLIVPKSQSNSINLYFTYKESDAIDANGNPIGLEEMSQQIRISIEAYNVKFEQLVIGKTEVTLDFKEVRSEQDVSNFSLFNTYTYSTLYDPLLVTLTNFNDVVQGGVTSHTYDLLGGDDIFYGGEGSDTVYMGTGNNLYVYNFGSDIVDGKATMDSVNNPQMGGTSVLRFNHENYKDSSTGAYIFNRDIHISFENGDIKIFNEAVNSRKEKDNSTSTFRNFDEIYLEEDTGISANQNNKIDIYNTAGFSGLKIYSGGDAGGDGDTLELHSAALLDFTDVDGASVTTVSNLNPTTVNDFDRDQKIIFAPNGAVDKNIFKTIIGSSGNDYYLAGDSKGYNVNFDAKGGTNTADFSETNVNGVIFDFESGSAIYGATNDTLKGISVFIGTDDDDFIYGSGKGNMTIYGVNPDRFATAGDKNTVTYENYYGNSAGLGVKIDYVTGKSNDSIIVDKYGLGKDTLFSIQTVIASQASDAFVMSMSEDLSIDGLGGATNSMDYSKDQSAVAGLTVTVNALSSSSAQGTVDKGLYNDAFVSINSITGSIQSDTFIISGNQEGSMVYDGAGGTNNTIDYSTTTGISIVYNLTTGTLDKKVISNSLVYRDNVTNFSKLTGTDEDDVFVATSNTWESNNSLFYDAGGSKYTGTGVTEVSGQLVGAGNVLYLDYDVGVLNLSLIDIKVTNFDTLRLSNNYDNKVEHSDTSFKVIWGGTGVKTDTYDATRYSNTITFDVSGDLVVVGTLNLYNFNVLMGSSSGTNFNVTVTSTTLNFNYYFEGGQSLQDVLDYSSTTSQINLFFDLGNIVDATGTVAKGSITSTNKDTFKDIESFVGGEGNDTFILNPYETYAIDGSGGFNTVSFANYSGSVGESDIDYSLYNNIQRFELTGNSDTWLIPSTAVDATIDGGNGLNTIKIDSAITGLAYTVGTGGIILDVLGPNASKQTLSNFEILYGTDANQQTSATDKVDMNLNDNSTASKNLYFILNNGLVDYTGMTNTTSTGVTLNIYTEQMETVGVKSTMRVDKGGSKDYYFGVTEITLTGYDDTIKLDISNPSTFDGIKINAGAGTNTIDVSDAVIPVIYDGAANTLGGTANSGDISSITGWSILKTGQGNDVFKLNDANVDLTIDAGAGTNELDAGTISTNLDFNFRSGTDSIDLRVTGNTSSTDYIKTTGITTVKGGKATNTFNGSSNGSYNIIGGVGADNILSYGSIANLSAGFSFFLGASGSSYVIKDQGYTDTIEEITEIEGTQDSDYFSVTSGTTVTSIDGKGGANELVVQANGSTGFIFDLDKNILTGGGLAPTGIEIFNFQILNGSNQDDTFIIVDESTLALNGSVNGGGGTNNTLNAKIVDANNTAVDLYVDLEKGLIAKNVSGQASKTDYMTIENINTINLGDGQNVFVFTGNLPANTTYNIDLGAGTNNLVSFENINYALSGTYDEIKNQAMGNGGTTIVNITGTYGLKLTDYGDTLEIEDKDNNVLVDGGGGKNTADYTAVSTDMQIDFTVSGGNQSVTRGSKVDTLTGFSNFKMGSGTNLVLAGGSSSITIEGNASANNTISYENMQGGSLVANLETGRIFKTATQTVDVITNFQVFKDSKGNDNVTASLSYTDIYGDSGDDTLNLSVLGTTSDTVTYGYDSPSSLDKRVIKSTAIGTSATNIKASSGQDASHSYTTIVFGYYNASVKTDRIEGRTYKAVSGYNNTLDYSALTTDGINVNFSTGTVTYVSTQSTQDTFSYFNIIIGTNQDDRFEGLNTSSNVTIDAGNGVNTVSFTGSSSALSAEIDSTGKVDTGNVNIILGSTGSLIVGGTKYNDVFYIMDMGVFNVVGGINGEGAINTLDFTKLNVAVTNFELTGTVYQVENIQRYVFSASYDNTITWSAGLKDSGVNYIDFGSTSNTNTFSVRLDAIANDPNSQITYTLNPSNEVRLGIKSNTFNRDLTLVNLTMLNLESVNSSTLNLGSFNAKFIGQTYASSSDLFTSTISISSKINFTYGITFTYIDYTLGTLDTSYIIKDMATLNLLGSSNGSTLNVTVNSSATQNRTVNINILDAVNMTIGSSITNSTITLANNALTVPVTSNYNQVFSLSNIANSTINLGTNAFKVEATNNTIYMPKIININAAIDFSLYNGQHGNIVAGTDWLLDGKKLTGTFANSFEVNFSNNKQITLTANNDNFAMTQSKATFNGTSLLDGGLGTNTLSIIQSSNSTDRIIGLVGDRVWIASSDLAPLQAGSNDTSTWVSSNSANWTGVSNFTIFDARGTGVNKDMNNNTIINVILDPTSPWTDIYMPYANPAIASQDTMQRTILNASGYSASGVNPTGGYSEGGVYNVSFVDDGLDADPNTMNRMMQVEATLTDTPTGVTNVVNVSNVQSIYGKKGQQDIVTFSALNTQQFNDLVLQLSQGNAFNTYGSNTINVQARKKYLYIDLDFARDETGNSANNTAAVTTRDQYDIIDFSAWQVYNPNQTFDIEIAPIRGDQSANALHLFGIGTYDDTKSTINPMIFIKASGYQHFILPQARVFHGGVSAYFIDKVYILEFPDVNDPNLYAAFDNWSSNSGNTVAHLFLGSSGESNISRGSTFINFTTFFLGVYGGNPGRNVMIAENFATEGLYQSNNVYLYLNQGGASWDSKPTTAGRTNNADTTTTNAYNDTIDFRGINSGNYYFSWGAWKDVEHNSTDFVSTSANTNREADSTYETFIKDTNTGAGIVFTNATDKNKVGKTDGLDSGTQAFYRMQGVNIIYLPNATNTYALGEVFWSSNGPVGPISNAGTKTYVKEVRGGTGIDTLLDNTVTSEFKTSLGGNQYGDSKGPIGHDTFNLWSHFSSATANPGHMERTYMFEDRRDYRLDIRVVEAIDSSYGDIKHVSNADYSNTKPSGDGTYTSEIARATYYNFEKLVVDDYSTDPISETRGTYYTGVSDNLTVKARKIDSTSSNQNMYKEFDLGGRYFKNLSTAEMEQQNVLHEVADGSNQVRMQFINDSSDKIDSSFILSDGYNGSEYTSYYGYKNFDNFEFVYNAGSGSNKTNTLVFNTDFDFAKMDGKEFTINMIGLDNTSTVNLYFQQDFYNYTVSDVETSNGYGGSIHTLTITEDNGTRSFKFIIDTWKADVNFIQQASESQVGAYNLTPDEIYNLTTYGNIDGPVEENPFMESSNSSDSLDSYGAQTNNQSEEDQSEFIAYSDGNSGLTSFGGGSRTEESKVNGADANSQKDDSKNNSSNQAPIEEDLWWLEEPEKAEEEKAKEDENSDDQNYAQDSMQNQEEQYNEDLENQNNVIEEQDGLQNIDISLLEKDNKDSLKENINNIDFEGFVERGEDFNMDALFNQAEELLSSNVELRDSLNEMLDSLQSLEEEAINITNQVDEVDSMSFALDSMFSMDENSGNTELNIDSNNKNKNNTNNFSNS
jgi:hypothetical protein